MKGKEEESTLKSILSSYKQQKPKQLIKNQFAFSTVFATFLYSFDLAQISIFNAPHLLKTEGPHTVWSSVIVKY